MVLINKVCEESCLLYDRPKCFMLYSSYICLCNGSLHGGQMGIDYKQYSYIHMCGVLYLRALFEGY